MRQLRDTQHEIADAIFEHDEQMIVAGMGGGKTAATLTALNDLHDADLIDCALVLAPPLVASTVWPKEPVKWEHLQWTVEVQAATGSPADRLKALDWLGDWVTGPLRVVSMSLHLCQWLKNNAEAIPPRCALVIDESSFFKGPRSKNGKALRSIAYKFPFCYMLTGTPRPNGYEDVWGQMTILKPGIWPAFDDWRRRNFMPKDYNGYTWEVHDFRAKELDRDMAPYVTSVDVDLDLPALSAGPDFDFEIELPEKARKAYDQMEDDLISDVVKRLKNEVDPDVVVALTEAVSSAKLAQIAQGYIYDMDPEMGKGEAVEELHEKKLDALEQIVDMAAGENLLIWYGYRHDVKMIEARLNKGKRLPSLGGLTTAKKGKAYIEAFGRGELPILLAHPASAAHGIDELKNGGRRHVWYCPTWSAEQYDQALARLHRPGQTRPVFSHQIVAKNTVDEVKVNRVAYKLQDQAEWSRLIERVRKEMEQ